MCRVVEIIIRLTAKIGRSETDRVNIYVQSLAIIVTYATGARVRRGKCNKLPRIHKSPTAAFDRDFASYGVFRARTNVGKRSSCGSLVVRFVVHTAVSTIVPLPRR